MGPGVSARTRVCSWLAPRAQLLQALRVIWRGSCLRSHWMPTQITLDAASGSESDDFDSDELDYDYFDDVLTALDEQTEESEARERASETAASAAPASAAVSRAAVPLPRTSSLFPGHENSLPAELRAGGTGFGPLPSPSLESMTFRAAANCNCPNVCLIGESSLSFGGDRTSATRAISTADIEEDPHKSSEVLLRYFKT